MVKLRKAFALILSGVILTSPVVVGQNSPCVECPTMTFSTAEIVYGPEGLAKVAPINAEDNQVLSDFLSTRKEWDDRFSTAAKPMPFVDLAISHAGVVPATIYTFGKLVIGQQLDVLKKENAELERAVIANLVAQPSYKYDNLARAKQVSEQMKNPQILDDEFSKQSGLSKTNWNKMTPEERDDALRIVTSKTAAEIGAAKSQLANKASKDEVFVAFAQLNLQEQKMGKSLVELQKSTQSIVHILQNNLKNETVLRAASLYLSGQLSDNDMQAAMKRFGVEQKDIDTLRSKKDLQSFQTGLQYATAVGALANRFFPNSDFAKITGQIAAAAAYVSVITKAASGDFLGAAAGLLGITGPGDQGNAQIAQQLAQLTKEVHQLREDIWTIHGDLVNRINALFVLNAVTLQAINLMLKQDLQDCLSFLDSRAQPQFEFDSASGRFPNLNALALHFNSGPRANQYGRCRAFLDKRIQPSEAAVQFFGKAQLVNNALAGRTTDQVVSFDDQLRAYEVLTEYFDSDPQARIGQFLFPSSDYGSLHEKMDQSSSANVAERFRTIPTHSALDANNPEQKFFYRHFLDTISPLALLECVDFELRLAPYSDLIDENPSPHLKTEADIKRLLEPGSREVSEGIERIKRAMDLVDLAIAQQAWLGGDALLPELSEEVFKPVTTGYDADLYKSWTVKDEYLSNKMNRRALAHLAVGKNNPLLLQNVIRYRIYQSMSPQGGQVAANRGSDEKKYNSFAYAFAAYHKEDPVYMNDLIGEKLTAKWEDSPTDPKTSQKLVPGWYLTFSYFDAETGTQQSDPLIPLPSVQDARTLSFAVSSDMRQLLEARERLKALLLGYQFVDYARNGKNGPKSLGRLATYSAAKNERLK